MSYVARMIHEPDEDAWPANLAPDDPGAMHLRYQWAQTLSWVMVGIGALDDSDESCTPTTAATTGMFFRGDPIPSAQANHIAQQLRVTFWEGVEAEHFAGIRDFWNNLQAQLAADARARGEILISGFEPFPHSPDSLRNDLVYWGLFNAIAADHGGYRLT